MKNFKRVVAILMVTFMMFNMGSSLAANTDDTQWSFNFNRTNFNLYTPSRDKTNASPVYFYVDSIKGDALKVRVLNGNKKTTSYSPIYPINRAGKYCLSSNVYEDGYRKAIIHGSKTSKFTKSSAYGDWSPDSKTCGW